MRTALVLTAAALLSTPVFAQDKAKAGPAVELRVKSVNELLEYAEYLGGLAGQEEQAKQAAAMVKAFTTEKGIAGVDPKRPFGLYASVSKDVIDSPAVVMIPLADEDAFLNLLRGQLSLDPKKGDDGVFQMDVPKVPPTVYFRFAKDYVYATARNKKAIDKDALIDPKEFFAAKDPGIVSLALHVDRIPEDVRKTAFGQFELQLNQEKEKKTANETPAQHKLKGLGIDAVASAAHSLLTDGRTLTLRVLVSPKQDELAVDVRFTATDGSDLAKALKSVAARKSTAITAAKADHPVITAMVNFGLPASLMEKFSPVIDDLLKDAAAGAKPEEREVAKRVLDALAPTIKSGDAEFGLGLSDQDGPGKLRLVIAARVKNGGEINSVIKDLAPHIPPDKGKLDLDSESAAGMPVHKGTSSDADLKTFFGSGTFWVVPGDDLDILSFEPDGAEAKRVATASSARGDVVRLEASVASAMLAFENKLKREKVKELIDETFDKKPQGQDTVTFVVTGGDKLSIRLTAKGRAVKLLAAIDREKKK
jgi:hypothetical protein